MIHKTIKNSLLILPLALIMSCSNKATEADTTTGEDKIQVKTTAAKAVEYADQIKGTGRLAFNNEYKMSFKTGGIVQTIYVKEGQRVKAGKLLATLKLNEVAAKTSQALIAVEKAERDYDRTKALYADSVATLEQLQNAESQLQNAQQNLRAAQFNQNESRIVAPANGTIQKILVKENEITGAGNPIIIFGAENTGKVLITNLSDVDVVKVKSSDKATLQFDAWHEQTFSGQVLEIAGMATPSTGTYEVKIRVEDKQNKLLPGFIGSTTITSSHVKHLLEIPIESLVQGSEKSGKVYKVENGQAIKQVVQIAEILNHKLLISSGLSNEDQVITEGLVRIKGDSIAVQSIH